MIKRLLFTAVLSALVLIMTANAQKAEPLKIKYAALGDSIASGYALPDYVKNSGSANSYTSLVKNSLPEIYPGYEIEYASLCVNGLTTDGLYNKLKSNPAVIKDADIITVSIGSNDILNVFNSIINNYLLNDEFAAVFESGGIEGFKNAQAQLEIIKNDFTDNAQLNAVCDAYAGKLKNLYGLIKSTAPDAKVYFTNIYNPFAKIHIPGLNVRSLTDSYIQKMNNAFESNGGYVVADVCGAFASSLVNVINVQDDLKSLDPHPNINGHKVISNVVIEKIASDNSKLHQIFDFTQKSVSAPVGGNADTEAAASDAADDEVKKPVEFENAGVSTVKFVGLLLNGAALFKTIF